MTNKLRRQSFQLSKYFDKSDNESKLSVNSKNRQQTKNYQNKVNETIEEVEDEKEDNVVQNNLITQSMERRRKASRGL